VDKFLAERPDDEAGRLAGASNTQAVRDHGHDCHAEPGDDVTFCLDGPNGKASVVVHATVRHGARLSFWPRRPLSSTSAFVSFVACS
jgi:hypothetical protein